MYKRQDRGKMLARRRPFGREIGPFRGDGELGLEPRKRMKRASCGELPPELVLTELGENGPVPAAGGRETESQLPRDLILTEFGEEGPIKVEHQSQMERLAAKRARK